MKRRAGWMSLAVALSAVGVATTAHSDVAKKKSSAVQQERPRFALPNGDRVGIAELSVVPGAGPGERLVKLKVKNNSADSANWLSWQIEVKIGTQRKFIGFGNITSLNGNVTQNLEVSFVPEAENVIVEALIDGNNHTETDAALRANNKKSVNVSGGGIPAGFERRDLNPALVASAGGSHSYTPRSGMTGCSMTTAPQGENSLAANMTCTAAGAGTLELFKNFNLKQGWKVNGVGLAKLGGGAAEFLTLPNAGGTSANMTISASGQPASAPVLLIGVSIVGPENTNPY